MATLGDTYGVTEPVQVDPSQILAVGKSEIVYVNEMGEQTSVPISHDQSIRMTRFGGYQSIEQANIAITNNNRMLAAQQQYEANHTNEIDEPESTVQNNTPSSPPYTLTEGQKAGLESGNYEVIKETYSTNRADPIDRYWYTNVEEVDPDTTTLENDVFEPYTLTDEQQSGVDKGGYEVIKKTYTANRGDDPIDRYFYSQKPPVEDSSMVSEIEGGYVQYQKAKKSFIKSAVIQEEVSPYLKSVAKSQQLQEEVAPYIPEPKKRYGSFSEEYFERVVKPLGDKYLSKAVLEKKHPKVSIEEGGILGRTESEFQRGSFAVSQGLVEGALYVPLLPALGLGVARSAVGAGKLLTDTLIMEDDIKEYEGKEAASKELGMKGFSAAKGIFTDFGTALWNDPGRTTGTVIGAVIGYKGVTKALKFGGKGTLGAFSSKGGRVGATSEWLGAAPEKAWHIVSQPHELIVDGIIGRGLKFASTKSDVGVAALSGWRKIGGSIFPEEMFANLGIKTGGLAVGKVTGARRGGKTKVFRMETGQEVAFSNEAIQKKLDMETAFAKMNIKQSKIRGEAELNARIKFETARDSGQDVTWTAEYPEMIWGKKNPKATEAYQESIITKTMLDVDAKVDVTNKIYNRKGDSIFKGESIFGKKGESTRVEQGLYEESSYKTESPGKSTDVFTGSDTVTAKEVRIGKTTKDGDSDVDVTNRGGEVETGKKKSSKVPLLAALGLAGGAGLLLGDKKKSAQGFSSKRYDFSGGNSWSKELKFEIADFDFKDLDTKQKLKKGEFDFDFDFGDVLGGKGTSKKSMDFNNILSTGKGKKALDWRKII
tara:strand:- start:7398 stop:9869 length:2472 start_codon:yes stop_codon:yes gene_type:complete